MVRRVTPLLLSSLILGSTAELTGLNSDSHTTPQQSEDADRLYAQSDNSDEGGHSSRQQRAAHSPTKPHTRLVINNGLLRSHRWSDLLENTQLVVFFFIELLVLEAPQISEIASLGGNL